ncbi:MAG: polymer-forming cytoskeletal protein [Muribaculaceae bacterium]|nr:polymer-forming cytoskeletal protein [Roseburia sp.]MCM1431042.1 polymer-forming cytoskeletal protein [Muribaculaceae bacterium]MCM1493302.1 polymer-forming cytoskeletal protein [Muribaculaceae bacterium]
MGLFKDFKEDFSQAVNEMMPGADIPQEEVKDDALVVDTLSEDVDVRSELSKLDGLLEEVQGISKPIEQELPPLEPAPKQASRSGRKQAAPAPKQVSTVQEEKVTMSDAVKEIANTASTAGAAPVNAASGEVVDETTVITASTVLTGDLTTAGSFDIQGTINGNVTCNGKMSVTGTINGNSAASEFFADVAKIEGEVISSGTVKIGAGSVIIGNISASSAVIAGAVKGDIDVQGPVVVDTSAVIMGNIKSRSVQINNGAVIEGFCSQCYADIDVQGLFDGK